MVGCDVAHVTTGRSARLHGPCIGPELDGAGVGLSEGTYGADLTNDAWPWTHSG
jgi:hypothetical protein